MARVLLALLVWSLTSAANAAVFVDWYGVRPDVVTLNRYPIVERTWGNTTATAIKAAAGAAVDGVATAITVARAMTPAELGAAAVRVAVKHATPTLVLLGLGTWLFDAVTNQWKQSMAPSSAGCPSCAGWGPVACTMNGVAGVAGIQSSSSSTCPSHPYVASDLHWNNCTNYSPECGAFPVNYFHGAMPAPANKTSADAAAAVAAAVAASPATVLGGLATLEPSPTDEVIGSPAAPQTVAGPASNPSVTKTSTTTTAAGTTVATTTTTNTFNYAGNTVTINQTQAATTTAPDGTTSAKTTVVSGSEVSDHPATDFCEAHPAASACLPFPVVSSGSTDPVPDLCITHPDIPACKDFCLSHPTLPACLELGNDSAPDLPETPIALGFASERHVLGTCPADLTTVIEGRSISMSWAPVCQFASGVRPAVILASVIGAMLFVFLNIKRASV